MLRAEAETRAVEFLSGCVAQADADGYQQFEEEGNHVPDATTPDDWWHDYKSITLVFGGHEVTFGIRRRRN